MNEKRRYPRVSIDLPATFELVGEEENVAVATTVNISEQGLCFNCREKLIKGQYVRLKIFLPDHRSVVLDVEVKWVKEQDLLVMEEYLIGVELRNGNDADAVLFQKFCQYHLNQKGRK